MTAEPITVEGGSGGTRADLAAVQAAASTLARAGAELLDVGGCVAAVATEPTLLPGALVDPAGYADVQQSLALLVARLPLEGARTTSLGVGVSAAAHAYGVAETGAERLVVTARNAIASTAGRLVLRLGATPYGLAAVVLPVAGWAIVRGYPLLLDGVGSALDDAAEGEFALDSVDDRIIAVQQEHVRLLLGDARRAGDAGAAWAVAHPEAVQHLVGAVPSAFSGCTSWATLTPRPLTSSNPIHPELPLGRPVTTVEELALVLSVLGVAAVPRTNDLDTVVRRVSPPTVTSAPTGVRDLLGRGVPYAPPTEPTASSTPSAYVPGRVRVDRLDGPQGRSWVVTIPPTQTWALTGHRSPFDSTSNVHLMAGLPAASSRATAEAMHAAGVRPGQPVMLVGYSQGGLTALQMASDPAVRERFDVTSVLTAGSPAGEVEPPPGVDVLSLEHRQDLVVAADGSDNPDDPRWTTVRRDLLTGTGVDPRVATEMPGRPWAAHHLTPYLGTAAMVDDSADESVRAWRDAATPFWAVPGTTATTTEYAAGRDW